MPCPEGLGTTGRHRGRQRGLLNGGLKSFRRKPRAANFALCLGLPIFFALLSPRAAGFCERSSKSPPFHGHNVSYVRSNCRILFNLHHFKPLKGLMAMPTWSRKLPAKTSHQGFDLRRTPASAPIGGIITCDHYLCCDTHFWNGRTTPCERTVNEEGKTVDDAACSACLAKQSWRTHTYVSAFNPKTSEHFIFECSANAAKAFEEYQQATGTLRGCIFHASRPKCTPNGKVVILTNTANLARQPIPHAPDIIRALAVIWRIPQTALGIPEDEPGAPTIRPDAAILDAMRIPPDNDSSEQDFLHRRESVLSGLATATTKANGKKAKS